MVHKKREHIATSKKKAKHWKKRMSIEPSLNIQVKKRGRKKQWRCTGD
jgi:hypothetical protein